MSLSSLDSLAGAHIPYLVRKITSRLAGLFSATAHQALGDPTLSLFCLALLVLIFRYGIAITKYHRTHRIATAECPQIPPRYPSFIPWLGHSLPFVLDHGRFMSHVAYVWIFSLASCDGLLITYVCRSYKNKLTSVVMKFPGFELYFLQDWETVKQTRFNTAVGPSILLWAYTHRFFFGIPMSGVRAYLNDNTGSSRKPRPGSNTKISDNNRIHHHTHSTLIQAVDGPRMITMTQRFMRNLEARFDRLRLSEDWVVFEDIGEFFQCIVSESILEALVGSVFLELNPSFNSELWAFDGDIPWLSRCLPSFIISGRHRRVNRLKGQIKRWYCHARMHSDSAGVDANDDTDPFWGTKLMRDRQEKIGGVDKFDDDCLASTDLGLLWG